MDIWLVMDVGLWLRLTCRLRRFIRRFLLQRGNRRLM